MRGHTWSLPSSPCPQKAPELEEADHVLTRQVLRISKSWDPTRGMFSIAWWEFSLLGLVATSLHPFVSCPYLLQGTAGFPSSSAEQCVPPWPHWIMLSGGCHKCILPPGPLELLWSCFPKFL